MAEVPTFLVAGHETTSTQTAWALFALAQRPEIQSRLRAELRSMPTDSPSADDLGPEQLPYLDAVVKEVMRVHSVVPLTERVAIKDDVLPVSEPYFDRKGNAHREIRYSLLVSNLVSRSEMLCICLGSRKARLSKYLSFLSTDRRKYGETTL